MCMLVQVYHTYINHQIVNIIIILDAYVIVLTQHFNKNFIRQISQCQGPSPRREPFSLQRVSSASSGQITSFNHTLFSIIRASSLQRNPFSLQVLAAASTFCCIEARKLSLLVAVSSINFEGNSKFPSTHISYNEFHFVVDVNCTYLVSEVLLFRPWNASRFWFGWQVI